MRFNEEMEKSTTVNSAEMFGNFFPELVQELRSLFQHVNSRGSSEAFRGLLHLKMFGNAYQPLNIVVIFEVEFHDKTILLFLDMFYEFFL